MPELANWWNNNYLYRKKISITASSTKAIPVSYPVRLTTDTAPLVTAGKMRSDRNDLRIVYWNGSSWTDLLRDYVDATNVFFPLQAQIGTDTTTEAYYLYYGYSGESTSKQPSSSTDWNTVYFGTAYASDAHILYHFRNGAGSTVTDDSGNGRDSSLSGSYSWSTSNLLGRGVNLGATSNDFLSPGNINYSTFTFEAYIIGGYGGDDCLCSKNGEPSTNACFVSGRSNNKLGMYVNGASRIETVNGFTANDLYHVAATFDGTVMRLYLNGVLEKEENWLGGTKTSTQPTWIGRSLGTNMYHFKSSTSAISSFPHALSVAQQPQVAIATEIIPAQIFSSASMLTHLL